MPFSRLPRDVAPFAGAWIEICVIPILYVVGCVAPFAGAWIEISTLWRTCHRLPVAPFAGAWIEINNSESVVVLNESLPSRERGLKSDCRLYFFSIIRSLPSRERGLKLFVDATHEGLGFVAPFAGAWIEIVLYGIGSTVGICRSLRGSVD